VLRLNWYLRKVAITESSMKRLRTIFQQSSLNQLGNSQMKNQDISKDPDMIELERMIEAGDRARGYARKHPEKSHESSEEPAKP